MIKNNSKTIIVVLIVLIAGLLGVVYVLNNTNTNNNDSSPIVNNNEETDETETEEVLLQLNMTKVENTENIFELSVANHQNNFGGLDITLVPENLTIVSFEPDTRFNAVLQNEINTEGVLDLSLGVLQSQVDPTINDNNEVVVGKLTISGFNESSVLNMLPDAEGLINSEIVKFNNFQYIFN